MPVNSHQIGFFSLFKRDENGQLIGLKVAGVEPNLVALQQLVTEEGLSLEEAIKPFTANPAKGLGLEHGRGMLVEGGAAVSPL